MVKILFPLVVLLAACNQPDNKAVLSPVNNSIADSSKPVAVDEIDTSQLLIPGERAGKIIINSSAETLESLLGKAT